MGYRQLEHHHHHGNRTAQKTTTPSTYYMENGTTFNLAIPCWYKELHTPIRYHHHCRFKHDHHGWPEPRHPDHSCQPHDFPKIPCHNPERAHHHHHHHYVDMASVFPIHLTSEGYDEITVVFSDPVEGLSSVAYVDESDDWVIRIFFSAFVEEATDKPYETRFIVKAGRDDESGHRVTDVVSRGKLKILPAPLEV